jgi:GNAT superfamily N-acetyltransferase
MTYSIQTFSKFPREHLPALASLHLGDHGLLSQLGYPFVLRYFEIAYENLRTLCVYAQDNETGKFIGYNLAHPEPGELTNQLSRDRIWLFKELARVFIRNPRPVVQLLISNRTIKTQMKNESDAIESVYLTIDREYRGQKIGRTLQIHLINEARKAGYKRIVGSIETWNEASIRMCLSNGFVITRTFREGNFLRYRIEKQL